MNIHGHRVALLTYFQNRADKQQWNNQWIRCYVYFPRQKCWLSLFRLFKEGRLCSE